MSGQGSSGMASSSSSAAAGTIAGFVARNATAPLDVLKIRFQLQIEPLRRGPGGGHYTGTAQAVRRIVTSEGVTSLWRGNIAASVHSSAYSAVQFSVYAATKRHLDSHPERGVTWWSPMVCGIAGAVASTVTTYPFDLVRTRFAAQGEPRIWASYAAAVRAIWHGGGVRGFFQGMGPTLVQIAPNMGLTFAAYDVSSRHLPETPVGRFIAGAFSGAAGKVFVLPLDVVKKRLQIRDVGTSRHARYGVAPAAASSMRGQAAAIFRVEGCGAFFKGVQPAVLKSAISAAVNFTIYHELIDRWSEKP